MTSLVYIVGARPNFVKMAPVIHECRSRLMGFRHVIVHTGQHFDEAMSQIFVDELGLPQPEHFLSVGSGGHGAQTARALERIERVLVQERPTAVLVAGDVNSTLAGALAAAKLDLPVAHIESGLRSFDRTMPEEINRVLTDQLSQWCFTHSPEAAGNLRGEGIAAERIHFVGNTMIDSLVRLRPHIERSDVHGRLGLERGAYALVTLHRPALVDSPLLEPTFASLARLARSIPVVFPMHPRTRARVENKGDALLRLIDPVGYFDFLALEQHAAFVLTDSGGIQEETTFLGVPCLTLRENTERPITLTQGTNQILGLRPEAIEDAVQLARSSSVPLCPPAGWDGHASVRIVDVLESELVQMKNQPAAATPGQ